MAEASPSQSRLTVLTGPLAGRELVLEEAVDNILIGSDEACRFHLPTPGVEPIHARLWMDASGVTIYETHSGRGIYVNDDRVTGQAPLRNGDILWLGTPGDDDVVMIQCRLPVRAAAASSAPAGEAPSIVVPPDDDRDAEATMVIVSDSEPERPAIEPEESTLEAVGEEAPASADFVIEETQAMAAPEAPHSEGFSSDEGFPFPPPPLAPLPAFEDETEAETVMRQGLPEPPMEPTVAMPPAHEPEPEAPAPLAPTLIAPPPTAPTPPPIPPPVHAAPPPTPRPAAAPAARPPRPAPAPREARPAAAPRPKKAGGGGSGLYVALGLVALAVLGGGGFFAWRFLHKGGEPTTAPTAPPLTTMAAAPATQPAVTAPPETQAAAPPTTAPVEEAVTTVKTPAVPSPSPGASKAPASPSPAPTKAPTKATTPATTAPAAPSADALRGQQVATLLGQADAAAAAHNPEQAAGLYDQVLRLEPENAKAGAGKTAAMAIVTSMRKSFVMGKTTVRSGKAAKGGPAGFDSEDVNLSKAPDYSGRIEFEVSPAHVKPGDAYTVHVFLTNDGKKSFKIGSLNVATTANGTKTGGPVTPAVKEVQPQQRVSLQDAGGTWTEGTTSWNLEVDVVSDHGDSFKNQVTWR